MLPLIMSACSHLRALRGNGDRGEVGPIGYAVMVSTIVLLALAVLAWGTGIAEDYMADVGGD